MFPDMWMNSYTLHDITSQVITILPSFSFVCSEFFWGNKVIMNAVYANLLYDLLLVIVPLS
jgi:hypothetical protein